MVYGLLPRLFVESCPGCDVASDGGSPASNGRLPSPGRLARRAGVAVRIDSSAGWGVTVTIEIPGDLMVRRPSDVVSRSVPARRPARQG